MISSECEALLKIFYKFIIIIIIVDSDPSRRTIKGGPQVYQFSTVSPSVNKVIY